MTAWAPMDYSRPYWDDDGKPHMLRADPAVMEWFRANDLDPNRVMEFTVEDVERGPINVAEIVQDERGVAQIDRATGHAQRVERTVPLLVPVPAMFLRTDPDQP